MFTSGGIENPPPRTTDLIENIVRSQLVEMVTRCTELAIRRGARSVSVDDLYFLIRHNREKLERLRTFLAWKEIRRNSKESDERDGVDFTDLNLAAPADDQNPESADGPLKGKATASLPWGIDSRYSVQIPGLMDGLDGEDMNGANGDSSVVHRLAMADVRTSAMTKEEYITWTEYRHASFTHRRAKRFRDWLQLRTITDYKLNDDFIDSLGFLAVEVVQELTRVALEVRDNVARTKHKPNDLASQGAMQQKSALFEDKNKVSDNTRLEPEHVQEAFQRLQNTRNRSLAMFMNGGRVPRHFPLQLVSQPRYIRLKHQQRFSLVVSKEAMSNAVTNADLDRPSARTVPGAQKASNNILAVEFVMKALLLQKIVQLPIEVHGRK
ncbi:Spt3 protein, putative [Paecilomyces variotii No. 5]|uniref:Spt3 protein, putative n=1 Tax=Byssochlamys spectabilis (strain No. 5 / NBRC 109023) TaxID=1356009 RepID=V5FKP2_BYSSN|nr:Spt3 protein, putative [Paecilomyces variotii No. 5]